MKNTPVEAGRFAFFSPLPMFFATCLWSWTVVFGIYFGLLQMDVPIPGWLICITVVPPLCCSPILGILGIIHGSTKRKEKRAWLGILLSAFCLVENALLFCAMGYLSRFQNNQQSPPNSNWRISIPQHLFGCCGCLLSGYIISLSAPYTLLWSCRTFPAGERTSDRSALR